ncbi:MAG: SH3 domain-containing protein, partial [Clostridia bacterium]|nr:SH3 domain-containing protein [Clostridia bacterium]
MKRFFKAIIVLTICASFIMSLPVAQAAYKKGDVNNDGVLSTQDTIIVLKIAARQKSPTTAEKTAADMDGDGIITTEDARQTLVAAITPQGDAEYVQSLIDAGFPKSYTENLLALHKKYPEWVFKPFLTGLKWSDALNGEHTPHKKQVISPDVQASFKCSCSACDGVVQEAGGWVSASEEAVAYYLDPRNFLNEQYIFQFESTLYEESQTQATVENIIKSTWMYNSNITYLDASGKTCTYTENGSPVKYSEAIMRAAKDSGLSAYYLASKMVQEVGSSTSSYAGGSSGKCSPYNGIYNYYNIGAYTGALDGLEWANGYMSASQSAKLYKTADTSTLLCTVPSGNELYYMGESGNFYKVKATVNGTSYTGYVAKSTVSIYTTYGRPWDNPYKSIYYGAKYIYNGFGKYQFTGYLQKFNVNSASGDLYNHEYMANVRAAAQEANITYKAYNSSGIMANAKIFSIPVFIDMPGAELNAEERFSQGYPIARVSSVSSSAVTLTWQAMDGAEGYEVYKKSGSSFTLLKTTTSTSYSDSGLAAGGSAVYKVRAYRTVNGSKAYSLYCPELTAEMAPAIPSGLTASAYTDSTATIKWNAVTCTGYAVYRSGGLSSAYTLVGNVTTNSFTDKNLLSGTKYSYKIKAYKGSGSNALYSGFSSVVSVITSGTAPQSNKTGTVKVSDSLNVREAPNTSATVLCGLNNGFVVTILSTADGWHKVTFVLNGVTYTGYVSADFVVVSTSGGAATATCPYAEPTTTLASGSTGEGVKWLQWHLWQMGYLTESDIDG